MPMPMPTSTPCAIAEPVKAILPIMNAANGTCFIPPITPSFFQAQAPKFLHLEINVAYFRTAFKRYYESGGRRFESFRARHGGVQGRARNSRSSTMDRAARHPSPLVESGSLIAAHRDGIRRSLRSVRALTPLRLHPAYAHGTPPSADPRPRSDNR